LGGWRRDEVIFGVRVRKLKRNPRILETFSMEDGNAIKFIDGSLRRTKQARLYFLLKGGYAERVEEGRTRQGGTGMGRALPA
jgi:hypothetical protein